MASGTVNTVRWVETRSLTMPFSPHTPQTRLDAYRFCMCTNLWHRKQPIGFGMCGKKATLSNLTWIVLCKVTTWKVRKTVRRGDGLPSLFPISQYAFDTDWCARADLPRPSTEVTTPRHRIQGDWLWSKYLLASHYWPPSSVWTRFHLPSNALQSLLFLERIDVALCFLHWRQSEC
jgi:hypothetical protein